ncbi:hypothetical protein G6O67_002150 [Ophiocordyceps sinensis]|uniref:CBM20 domain-containing protein n=1 Tax=Ophiocordyceps sinensis TaxID=72228 RepID=A0A8H4PTP9_9HYPO|nr:hypothetical protein G6O67_002150 [Ophiocordyceps sinensis]
MTQTKDNGGDGQTEPPKPSTKEQNGEDGQNISLSNYDPQQTRKAVQRFKDQWCELDGGTKVYIQLTTCFWSINGSQPALMEDWKLPVDLSECGETSKDAKCLYKGPPDQNPPAQPADAGGCKEGSEVQVKFSVDVATSFGDVINITEPLAWEPAKAVEMSHVKYDDTAKRSLWEKTVPLRVGTTVEYKFVNVLKSKEVKWERKRTGNRRFTVACTDTDQKQVWQD